jgi:hypothetical protein
MGGETGGEVAAFREFEGPDGEVLSTRGGDTKSCAPVCQQNETDQ